MKIAANEMRYLSQDEDFKILYNSRVNYWYINVYVLWLNTILNIIVPIVSLVILNINTSR